ncbi:protein DETOXIFICATION 16 [Ricinus communis]|uniref:Protein DETOXIFICATION n=1 Tax=Ricinus communis TaxID=3988 RepID=B9SJP0_RICCO|nr:protein DETOXIFICATION 16 [Ricinus communis]EEF36150.1 TRANSPARENT TESTA 12 protein, putative [Ricinus communis]|eukprot:XP_002526209.1 protein DETOXIFICATION 16 [Ricinus communis]
MDVEKHESCPQTPNATRKITCESKIRFSRKEFLMEMKQQLLLAGPLISVFFCLGFIQMICLIFVGHLGELALSGASIATSFASMAGYTLLRGMGSALETFSGQSYGAKQYHLLGVHLQRGMLVLLVMSIPIGILFAFSADILKFARQNPEIADEAGKYARFLLPGFSGISILECHIRFLQTQSKVVAVMISAGIATALHIPICWLLVFKSELRNRGAALANTISYWIISLLLIAYVRLSPSFKETWTGFSKEALHGIPKFLKLAIPATIMLSLEVWSLEIVVLLSGLLPNPKLEASVLSISFNMHMMTYMIQFGLSGAVSTRVSNELGAGRPQSARLAVYAVVIMVIAEGILVATIMVSGQKVWGYLFSKERRVVNYVGEMMPPLAVSHLINGFQTVLSGTCRGCGLQKVGAYVNLGAYYLVGIPCAVVLGFVYHIGGKGLWIGITVAMFVQATSLSIIIFYIDWEKQARQAKDRVGSAMVIRDADALS